MEKNNLKFKKLFWFLRQDKDVLDFSRDRHLVIHQVLALGTMKDVKGIFREYGTEVIREEFKKPVRGLYAPSVLHFFEHILKVKLKDREQYIKNIHGKTSS